MRTPLPNVNPLSLIFVYVVVLLILFSVTRCAPKDDTDPTDGRSGFVLKIDNLTGCQYLTGTFGITPRLDANGHHICKAAK